MRTSIQRAIRNITDHGDTDIFPYPIENRIIFDKSKEVADYLCEIDKDFEKFITSLPPANYGTLAPVGYTGFRWATQIDPLWNVYYLALVLELSERIESARIPATQNIVFSYRLNPDNKSSNLFDKNYGWRSFTEHAIKQAADFNYVVSCDISEFYPRLNHHRLDNALRQLDNADTCRKKLMDFLSNFSETYSFGLPVGGPASRILSELTLNQIDRLLRQRRIAFCRFADDYYLFANDNAEAFKSLVYLSQILQRNQGLQLQKSKTRIMSAAEFLSTNPLSMDTGDGQEAKGIAIARQQLFTISLHFDPYAPTAQEDYKKLETELKKFPILDLIKSELTKSRVNIALSRKLVQTLKFVSEQEIDDAARTLIENHELLYPVYFNVMAAIRNEFHRLKATTRQVISRYIISLIDDGAPVMGVDLNLQYAIRLLAEEQSEEAAATLTSVYDSSVSEAVRRDIILIMTKWRDWTWLSDQRANFRKMSFAERRAYIIASYSLKDEGKHWRDHTADEFSPLEKITRDWMSERVGTKGWEIPL